jgi:hypothetical protein
LTWAENGSIGSAPAAIGAAPAASTSTSATPAFLRCRTIAPSTAAYAFSSRPGLRSASSGRGFSFDAISGMSVSEEMSEHPSASEIVIPTSRSHVVSCVLPPTISGRKTIRLVAVAAATAIVTPFAPASAAAFGSGCVRRVRSIDSSTTMALSTSMPTPSMSPIIDSRLSVLPMK